MKIKMIKKETMISLIAIFLFFVIATTVIVFIIGREKVTYKNEMYQYYAGEKCDYYGETVITRQQEITKIKSGEAVFEHDTSPIYFEKQPKILLPSTMSVVLPQLNVVKKLNYFTEISEIQQGDFFVKKDGLKKVVSDCFLFDGKNLYVFLEKTTIKYLDKTIELEPFSFVSVNYNQSIEIYDYKNKKHTLEQTDVCDVVAETKSGSKISLSTDTLFRKDGQEQLLFSQPELLSELS